MGFASSFASVPDSLGITLGGGSDQSVDGIVSGNQGMSNTDSVAPSPSTQQQQPTFIQKQTDKAKSTLDALFTVRDKSGQIMPAQTLFKNVGKLGGPYGFLAQGVLRGFYDLLTFNRDSAIEAELQTLADAEGQTIENKDMPDAIEGYYTAEHAENQARGEDDLSVSMPRRLLSQGQQDPAAQPTASALFGPTHIYGALPGQRQRRGAYQYIPPTFGPIRS